ncbi:expressed unknown protein [Ectocarpus siliculosus]|uniref:SET domain-containing protein n=1 Tax=Ectocarpus siliculosus TaxID=2880 RepID=D8LKD6_ECTSI|nr:expressed unknown protein [Ectocarpus siliculosus]|eukprot:CBN76081.1 expressed unknown protein [Ectocarpus siliculosus]
MRQPRRSQPPRGMTGRFQQRKGTPSVRTLSKAAAKTEQWAKLRKEVTTVQSVDIFSSDFDSTTRPLEVDRDSAMLVFVNLGADPSLLDGTDEATERLHAGLVALESVLHPRGTVVIAMGSIANFDFPCMEARLKAADLAMEKNPVVSIYLEGQPGRIPERLKNHLTTQGCSVLVAHKTNDFACHGHPLGKRRAARGAASSASFKSPRQASFEAVGFVVSDKHPSTATFLSTSTADHLINRFTVPGDCVLVTTFEENPLASLVLGQGRHLGALVADSTKAENAEVEVNEACVTATKHGWFAELNKTEVIMTGSTLPSCIPSSNLSAHAAKQYESQRATDDEEDTDGDVLSALDVARELAGAMELEIKDSSHGLGLFATKDIEFGGGVPMTAMGAYEILTLDEMIAEVNSDGDPRYPVLEYDNLVALLGDDEIVREGSKLWLRPTRESPLFYVNSSFPDAHLQNLLRESKLNENPPASADEAKKVLVEAAKGVSFRVSRTVRAGEELLIHYPVAPENSGDSSGEDGTGSQGREKRQRRSSRSSAEKPTYVESASDDDAMEG